MMNINCMKIISMNMDVILFSSSNYFSYEKKDWNSCISCLSPFTFY